MDLCKAYGCLPHDLMFAKLEAYDLAKEGPKSFAEFLKVLYWDFYFSVFLLMTFFLSLKSQTFLISQMIVPCIPMAATFL